MCSFDADVEPELDACPDEYARGMAPVLPLRAESDSNLAMKLADNFPGFLLDLPTSETQIIKHYYIVTINILICIF